MGYINDDSTQRPFIMTLSILCPIGSFQQRTRTRRLGVYAAHLAVELDLERVYGVQDSQNLLHDLQCGSLTATEDDTTFVSPILLLL